ncbi:hypothetical protein ACGRHY_19395 [Streptomyces sp. HK10]|uniref:hypothetical protein n=1 Tax=Streptomyces sp. HK10 TaxID=3373255 RepID=UPI00374864A1
MTAETRRGTVRALVAVVLAVAATAGVAGCVDAGDDNGGTRVEVPRGGAGAPAVTVRAANGDVTVRLARRRDRS